MRWKFTMRQSLGMIGAGVNLRFSLSSLPSSSSRRRPGSSLNGAPEPGEILTLTIHRADGTTTETSVKCRLDTPIESRYYAHGGIMPFVLRELLASPSPLGEGRGEGT